METNVLLVKQDAGESYAYIVYLDKLFVSDLRNVSDIDYVLTLWYHLLISIRKWVTERDEVSIKDLIAPKVFCDEMEDTREISDYYFKNHELKVWSDLEVAQNFDAATVGLYIARLIEERPEKLESITFDDIVELVVKARNGNWHKLIE